MPIPTQIGADPGQQTIANGTTIASVTPGTGRIDVAQPSMYTPTVAAHESTHIFQGTRNGDFQRASQSLLPQGVQSAQDYDYGGVKGLQSNPLKSIGNYNPEQQARMVEDLTSAQAALPAKDEPRAIAGLGQQKECT